MVSVNDNEFLLFDRLQKIRSVTEKYGESNFFLSYSGGKDSTVLSALLDEAMPNNEIPRVYVDTGIDLRMVRDFVYEKAKTDKRIVIIPPKVSIRQTLENEGYPFKSKWHSHMVERFNRIGWCDSLRNYCEGVYRSDKACPAALKYQFSSDFKDSLKISDHCCLRMKEDPLDEWGRENKKPYALIGIMRDEGGRRENATCLSFDKDGSLTSFKPLAPLTKAWEDWYIKERSIKLCAIYYPPYNRERTGCKGCPFSRNLQEELDMLEKFFPAERKQCELLWAPVYKEYRRIGYRLKKDENGNPVVPEKTTAPRIPKAEHQYTLFEVLGLEGIA